MSKTAEMKELQGLIDILPQKFPMIMIDEIVDFKEGESLTAIKNITGNEWMFEGVNLDLNKFPETLIMEGAAQSALILYHYSKIKSSTCNVKYIVGKIESNFSNQANIGDTLIIHAIASKMLDSGGYSEVEVKTNDMLIAKMILYFSVKNV